MRKLNMICLFFFVLFSMVSVSYSACEGDLNCDGDVDGSDLADFAADYGSTGCPDCIAAPVAQTGQPNCYDENGSEIDCAGTGQDGEYQMGVAWPDPRFTDNSNGTVTDNLTGLIWLKNANCYGAKSWSDALTFVNSLYDGWTGDGSGGDCGLSDGSSANDWRLPNVKELHSLTHFGFAGPAVPNTAGTGQWTEGDPFTGVQLLYYWSSTTSADLPSGAYLVLMANGLVNRYPKSRDNYVWPVRGVN